MEHRDLNQMPTDQDAALRLLDYWRRNGRAVHVTPVAIHADVEGEEDMLPWDPSRDPGTGPDRWMVTVEIDEGEFELAHESLHALGAGRAGTFLSSVLGLGLVGAPALAQYGCELQPLDRVSAVRANGEAIYHRLLGAEIAVRELLAMVHPQVKNVPSLCLQRGRRAPGLEDIADALAAHVKDALRYLGDAPGGPGSGNAG